MLHIIGVIFKILGIILLVLIGLLLAILLSVLLVPVRYSGEGKKAGEALYGKVTIHWCLHLIHVCVSYKNKELDKEVYVLGIPVFAWKEKIEQRRAEKEKKKAASLKAETEKPENQKTKVIDQSPSENTISEEIKEQKTEEKTETEQSVKTEEKAEAQQSVKTEEKAEAEQIEKIEEKTEAEQIEKTEAETATKTEEKVGPGKGSGKGKAGGTHQPKEKKGVLSKIREKISKTRDSIRKTLQNLKQKKDFLMMEDTRQALKSLWAATKKILRHIFPVKLQGKLVFGFDDPAKTGYALALAGSCYPLYHNQIQIVPVFDQAVLEGNIKFRGRIVLGYLALQALLLYRNKEIKRTYGRFRHKEEA